MQWAENEHRKQSIGVEVTLQRIQGQIEIRN